MEVILAGFLDTFTPTNILFIFLGISMGVFVGAVPGLNGPMAIALAVPMTYYMSPLAAIAFLVGINKGGTYGGFIAAILLNTPGTPEILAVIIFALTIIDGLEAKQLVKGLIGAGLGIFFFLSIIRGYLSTPQLVCTFGWQGGEPMLMGLDFFRRVTDFQQKHGRAGTRIANGIQTNATLIDDAAAEHFARYRFLIGCSLDGPAQMHDRYRRATGGGPSHAAVLRGINLLERHRVEFNILVLVTQANVHHAKEVYRYLVDLGFYYHQYIPCVEVDKTGTLLPFVVTGRQWGDFMCEIFDLWYYQDRQTVSIRYFDSILKKLIDGSCNICTLGNNCCQYFVVEYNGDIYPCDFFLEKT
jgi:hypothetical protein